MTTDGAQLLRSLGSGIRHGVDSVSALGPTRSGLDPSESFASLMQSVQAGTFSSGAPVGVASNSGIELSSRQLQRLAEAADRATASGANRAVVLIDGMALKLDVNQRMITGKIDPSDASKTSVMTDLDAIIRVPPEAGAADLAGPGTGNAAADSGLSLLRSLSGKGRLTGVDAA